MNLPAGVLKLPEDLRGRKGAPEDMKQKGVESESSAQKLAISRSEKNGKGPLRIHHLSFRDYHSRHRQL